MIIPAKSFLSGLKDDGLMYVPRPIVELKVESVTLLDDIIRERLSPPRNHFLKSLEGQVAIDGWEARP